MKITQVVYRTRQFGLALRTQSLTAAELAPARAILTAKQMQLFARLQPSEQIHALRVLQTVQQHGVPHPDLYTAALLHDIGKARAPLKLWERVLIVLVRKISSETVKEWGRGQPQGWRRAFVIAEQHPAWGGELAAEADTAPLAVSLIRRHQSPAETPPSSPEEEHLLRILQAADHQN